MKELVEFKKLKLLLDSAKFELKGDAILAVASSILWVEAKIKHLENKPDHEKVEEPIKNAEKIQEEKKEEVNGN